MKQTLTLAVALLSFSAQSAVELYVQNANTECTISNDKVVKTTILNKGKSGFTTTAQIKSFGIYELAEKALQVAQVRSNPIDIKFTVTVDGQTAQLNYDDSDAAKVLIQFLANNCH
jgi:predicted Zn-dependent protease